MMTVDSVEKPSILLVSDMAGYGKVALSVMIPMLSRLGFDVSTLPTALVSNTLDYGKFEILETTGFMKNALSVWNELDFTFDAVYVGFLFSPEQSALVQDYCASERERGVPVFFDPIMGDWGHLYNGVSEADVEYRRGMCSVADVIMPNMTEAQFLCKSNIGKNSISKKEACELTDGLRALGASNIIITSACVDGSPCTLVSENGTDELTYINYDEIPLQMPGTGDIFASSLMGAYLQGNPLDKSVRYAMKAVSCLLGKCVEKADCLKGIPIEAHLDDLSFEELMGIE